MVIVGVAGDITLEESVKKVALTAAHLVAVAEERMGYRKQAFIGF